MEQLIAHYPGAINGVLLGNLSYLALNSWGLVIDGRNIIAESVTTAYAKASYNVTYMDVWFSNHVNGGEIHCGSNIWRSTDALRGRILSLYVFDMSLGICIEYGYTSLHIP